jgi:hypothetical protein
VGSGWIDQGLCSGEHGDAGEAGGCDVGATGTVTQQSTSVSEPAEGSFDHLAPGQHGKALPTRRPLMAPRNEAAE